MNRRGLLSLGIVFAVLTGCGGGDDDGNGGASPTATVPSTATATEADDSPTPTRVATATNTRPAATATATPIATATDSPTEGATPTATQSPGDTATVTPTPTVTATATPSPTPTQTPQPPRITHFGVARADDVPQMANTVDEEGRPVFVRLFGSGMTLIVEAAHGARGPQVGRSAYDSQGGAPDMQMIVSRPLGNGSTEVCDYDRFDPSKTGGIPATEPFEFSDESVVIDATNDFGCRVNDGTGEPVARDATPEEACTRGTNGLFGPVDPESELQYCLPIASKWSFPVGDTIVGVRVRDERGALSEPEEIVIRVLQSDTSACVGLGERPFTISRPESMLLSSALPGEDVSSDPWEDRLIRICAGPDIGSGIHPLRLRADAFFGLGVLDGSNLCVKLFADGSEGALDCNGGTPADVRVTEDLPNGPVLESGLGVDAGTGAATLSVQVAIVALPAGSTAAECGTATQFGGAFRTVLTTAEASALVTNTSQGPDASIAASGVNFDCESWTQTDGPGTFVFAFPATNTISGDIANAFVLED